MAAINVTVRVEEDVKRDFDNFCNSVGMNVSTAINMFMRAVLRTRNLPFPVTDVFDDNKDEIEQARRALRVLQTQSVINGTSEMSMEEIDAEITAYRQEKQGV
jgi:DNA-damage-inducible protein J